MEYSINILLIELDKLQYQIETLPDGDFRDSQINKAEQIQNSIIILNVN